MKKEKTTQTETKSTINHNRPNNLLIASLITLFFISSGIAGYVAYQNSQLKKQVKQLEVQTNQKSSSLPSNSIPNQPNLKPQPKTKTASSPSSIRNWNLYKNDKFGFTLKYPPHLNVKPTEIDIKSNYEEYMKKCDSGFFENGCGGGRWPDFKISFIRKNGKLAFDVRIYQLSVKNTFGGIERDNFTYIISDFVYYNEAQVDFVDEKTLSSIKASLKFFKPDKPLNCLWDPQLAGFNPQDDKDYIRKHSNELVKLTGAYFNIAKNSCQETTLYTYQKETDKPVFEDLSECQSVCN